jgi:PAS domain S-box-containing protein
LGLRKEVGIGWKGGNQMEPKNILLVEDEAIIALSEKNQLESRNYKVVYAPTGEKAIDEVKKNPDINLVLMDINLGNGISGTEAARKILAFHEIPLLFLSSHTEPEIVEKTESITNYGYVVKNSSITVLDASMKMAFKLFAAKQEIQRREENYRRGEIIYRTIFEQASAGVAIVNAKTGEFIKVNKKCCDIFGYEEKSMLKQSVASITHPDDLEQSIANMTKLYSGEISSFSMEKRFIKKDSQIAWVNISVSPIEFSDSAQKTNLVIYEDITIRKKYENEKQTREKIFSSIFYDSDEAKVLVNSENGMIIDANKAAADFYGSNIDKLKTISVYTSKTKNSDEISISLEASIKGQKSHFHGTLKVANGSIRNVEMFVMPIEIEGGECIYCVIHDVEEKIIV